MTRPRTRRGRTELVRSDRLPHGRHRRWFPPFLGGVFGLEQPVGDAVVQGELVLGVGLAGCPYAWFVAITTIDDELLGRFAAAGVAVIFGDVAGVETSPGGVCLACYMPVVRSRMLSQRFDVGVGVRRVAGVGEVDPASQHVVRHRALRWAGRGGRRRGLGGPHAAPRRHLRRRRRRRRRTRCGPDNASAGRGQEARRPQGAATLRRTASQGGAGGSRRRYGRPRAGRRGGAVWRSLRRRLHVRAAWWVLS